MAYGNWIASGIEPYRREELEDDELKQCAECGHLVYLLIHGRYCRSCDRMIEAEEMAERESDNRHEEGIW